MKARFHRLSAVALLVTAATLVSLTAAQATFTTSPGAIRPVSSGRAGSAMCIDIPYSSNQDGQTLTQWGCTGNANQSWRLVSLGSNQYAIVSNFNNKCVDIPYGSASWGQTLTQYSCHYGANQRWSPIVTSDGRTMYINPTNSLCINVSGNGSSWGSALQQWGCYDYNESSFSSGTFPSFGYLDGIDVTDSLVQFTGWTAAASEPTISTNIRLTAAGQSYGFRTANLYRGDVGQAFSGYGDFHGFQFTEDVTPGQVNYCVEGWSYGVKTDIDCGIVDMIGELEFAGSARTPAPASNAADAADAAQYKSALDSAIDWISTNSGRDFASYKGVSRVGCPLGAVVKNNVLKATKWCHWGVSAINRNLNYAYGSFTFSLAQGQMAINKTMFNGANTVGRARAVVAHEIGHLFIGAQTGEFGGQKIGELNADCFAKQMTSNSGGNSSYAYLSKVTNYTCPIY